MKFFMVALSLMLAGAFSAPEYGQMWKDFRKTFSKSYAPIEEEQRLQIFMANIDWIQAENSKGHSYTVGVTQFADLTADEFKKHYYGYNPALRKSSLESAPWQMPNISIPESIDWVQKGGVTPVKNQAQCGSCWAFSTTGAVEGAYFVASGKLVSLSEEDLVSCDTVDNGCGGGAMDNGFDFAKNYGICREADDPYTSGQGNRGICNGKCKAAVTVTSHVDVPPKDEEALKAAVAMQPVSVAIEADQKVFQLYTGGVLNNVACGTKLDHGVLVVGYGTENGHDFWKVKNSWGETWGEQGFIRIARGSNMCGIAMDPSYPTGAKAAGDMPKPPVPSPTPAPAPTPAGTSHYEDPKGGCQADEKAISIQGIDGSLCSPECNGMTCPTDVPSGVTAKPQCALKTPTGEGYCALICTPGADDQACGVNASCKPIQSVGICTYDDDAKAALSVKMEGISDIVV
jgi:C1A family cysteine protease